MCTLKMILSCSIKKLIKNDLLIFEEILFEDMSLFYITSENRIRWARDELICISDDLVGIT